MKPRVSFRLNMRILPGPVILLLAVQIRIPSDGWLVLPVGLNRAWPFSCVSVRTLARHLRLQREMRFGWPQLGDSIEERSTL